MIKLLGSCYIAVSLVAIFAAALSWDTIAFVGPDGHGRSAMLVVAGALCCVTAAVVFLRGLEILGGAK